MTSFGGIHLVHQKVISKGFKKLIDSCLGKRSVNAQYCYGDLLVNMCYTALCGGDCAEDINEVAATFSPLKGLKVPSPDTILNMQKELATPVETLLSGKGNENRINFNDRLNDLMLKSALHFHLLNTEEQGYTLDFDHQFISTEKYDTTYSYKKQRGYFPGVACINNIPVYIENRNGNCHVNFNQLATLKRTAQLLDKNGIVPLRWRMDSGSYIKEVNFTLEPNNATAFGWKQLIAKTIGKPARLE